MKFKRFTPRKNLSAIFAEIFTNTHKERPTGTTTQPIQPERSGYLPDHR
jgi:hypothetical protein